jgi:hypothetical protein
MVPDSEPAEPRVPCQPRPSAAIAKEIVIFFATCAERESLPPTWPRALVLQTSTMCRAVDGPIR